MMRWIFGIAAVCVLFIVAGCSKPTVSVEPSVSRSEEPAKPVRGGFGRGFGACQTWEAPFGEVCKVIVLINSDSGQATFSDWYDNTAKTVDLDVKAYVALDRIQDPIISTNGEYVAVWSKDELGDTPVGVLETNTGKLACELPVIKKHHNLVSFSPDSQWVVADFIAYHLKSGEKVTLDDCFDRTSHPNIDLPKLENTILWLDNDHLLIGGDIESFESSAPVHQPILAFYSLKGTKKDLSKMLGKNEFVTDIREVTGEILIETENMESFPVTLFTYHWNKNVSLDPKPSQVDQRQSP